MGAGHGQGREDAPVHVVELSDYQCPACAAAHASVAPAVHRLVQSGSVRYVLYDLPLPSHGNAIPAAVVANCSRQHAPAAFAGVRDRFFRHQAEWKEAYPAEPALLRYVAAVGADTAAVADCVRRTGAARGAVLRRTWESARAAGVTFTPAWAVDGKVVPWAELETEIQAALRRPR
jgi:protein-disulfide isomerase